MRVYQEYYEIYVVITCTLPSGSFMYFLAAGLLYWCLGMPFRLTLFLFLALLSLSPNEFFRMNDNNPEFLPSSPVEILSSCWKRNELQRLLSVSILSIFVFNCIKVFSISQKEERSCTNLFLSVQNTTLI